MGIVQNKIKSLISSGKYNYIIESNEFYFQKAKDALNSFLSLEVNKEVEVYLLQNSKRYEELKDLFVQDDRFKEFGNSVLTLISYCDSNALNKKLLNQYEDKRVLALAFVRMNNWIEQLINYKFKGELITGSIKNAIDYLNNPDNNFTMLSENHRSQISTNLFKINYVKDDFKKSFFDFFSDFNLYTANKLNYTQLLTRICYDFTNYWKDSLIGLVSPDNTGWLDNAIKDTQNGNFIALWNHKKPNGKDNTLKLLRQAIEDNGYFRIFYTSSYKVYYVAEIIDFVKNKDEFNSNNWNKDFGDIEWYNDEFTEYKDGSKSASWIYLAKKVYKVNPDEFNDFKYYKNFGYPSVGCQAPVISYKTKCELLMQNAMSKYKNNLLENKNIILTGAPGTGKTYLAKQIAKQIIGIDSDEELSNSGQFGFVQFHPSYDYTDFVEGLRPTKPDANGNIGFELKNGVFKEFCIEAKKHNGLEHSKNYVFVIDEINRGEISKIFGELFFSIDPSYRGIKGAVKTQYANMHEDSNETFYIPENMYIIGSMNDIDRSVESFDFAMRRRFTWIEITAEESTVNMNLPKEIVDKMQSLNQEISDIEGLGNSFHIGGAYFLDADGNPRTDLDKVYQFRIEPLLKEYLRGLSEAENTLKSLKEKFFSDENNR